MYNKLIFGLVSLSCLFISISCSNKIDNQTQSKQNFSQPNTKIKIKWLAQWYGRGKKETLIREIAREFSLLNQNIEVELEFPHEMLNMDPTASTFSKTTDTIVNMVKNNEWPYDIMLCDAAIYKNVGKLLNDPQWGKKYLVNFIDQSWYIDSHKEKFFTSKKHTDLYGDIAPGVFIEGQWAVLYASSEIQKRLGIEVKPIDMTMDDFLSYAKSVYEYNQAHSEKITFLAFPQNDIMPFFNQIVMSALGKDSANNLVESLDALNQAYIAFEKLAPYKPIEQHVIYKGERDFHPDKTLFIFHYSWINAIWQKANPEGEEMLHPSEIPSIDNKKAPVYSGKYNCVFVVPKNAKHRKEAEQLMKFISSQETAEKWVKYSKCPTGLKSKISYGDFGTDKYTKFSKHISQKYGDKLEDINLANVLFKSNNQIDFQVIKVLNGIISADDALKEVLKQVGIK